MGRVLGARDVRDLRNHGWVEFAALGRRRLASYSDKGGRRSAYGNNQGRRSNNGISPAPQFVPE